MDRSLINAGEERMELDIADFLRRVKQRQEQHRKFFQFNNRTNSSWTVIADQIFIHDEIIKLRAYAQQKLSIQELQQKKDLQLVNRYESLTFPTDQPAFKKFILKVLEIGQTGKEALSESIEYYSLIFKRLKCSCLKMCDSISLKPGLIIKMISHYFIVKVAVQAERLVQIARCLELSDFSSLENLKEIYYQKLFLKEHFAKDLSLHKHIGEENESKSITPKKITIKKQIPTFQSEKQIRVRLTKKQQRHQQKLKKLQAKKLKKYVHSLIEVMQVNKDQMMQDYFIQNKDWQSKRIYTQLSGRNKLNMTQIQSFLDRSAEYKEVTTGKNLSFESIPPITSLQQELIFQSKTSADRAKLDTSYGKDRMKNSSPTRFQKDAALRYTKAESFKAKSQSIRASKRTTVNNIEQTVNNRQKSVFQSERQIATDFVEINIKNHFAKQRFPEIYARASSVDNSKLIKKKQQLKLGKQQKTSKFQIQIQKKMVPQNHQAPSHSTNKKTSLDQTLHNHSNQKYKGRQKVQNKIRLQLKTLGPNFFEEIGKRISKFCEMKKNIQV